MCLTPLVIIFVTCQKWPFLWMVFKAFPIWASPLPVSSLLLCFSEQSDSLLSLQLEQETISARNAVPELLGCAISSSFSRSQLQSHFLLGTLHTNLVLCLLSAPTHPQFAPGGTYNTPCFNHLHDPKMPTRIVLYVNISAASHMHWRANYCD